jgi:hypothetical protein
MIRKRTGAQADPAAAVLPLTKLTGSAKYRRRCIDRLDGGAARPCAPTNVAVHDQAAPAPAEILLWTNHDAEAEETLHRRNEEHREYVASALYLSPCSQNRGHGKHWPNLHCDQS